MSCHSQFCCPPRLFSPDISGITLPLVVDNGTDPILGPPFPPVNYEAFGHADNVPHRLTWTVPQVLLTFDPAEPFGTDPSFGSPTVTITAQCFIVNYDWPDWDNAKTYINNERVLFGGVRYYSVIDGNIGNTPGISPAWATDDTVFTFFLRINNTETGNTGQWAPFGNSNNDAIFYPDFHFNAYGWAWPNYLAWAVQRGPTPPQQLCELYFYIQATSASRGTTIFSQTFKFLFDL